MLLIKQAKKTLLIFTALLFIILSSSGLEAMHIIKINQQSLSDPLIRTLQKPFDRHSIYDSLHLGHLGLSRKAFNEGLSGLDFLTATGDIQNSSILSIADLSLPSSKKRLFVIDLHICKLIFNTYVSHGRNSGREMATQFSNKLNSCQSSLGFYVTGATYIGHHGYSLKLDGKEEGINDNALARGIVMHSAAYVNEQVVKSCGCIGRSEGCPAVPEAIYRKIIRKIKNGTCLFLYSPDQFYASHSKLRITALG